MLYKEWEAVIKLFHDYSTSAPETKCETVYGKECPSDLASQNIDTWTNVLEITNSSCTCKSK